MKIKYNSPVILSLSLVSFLVLLIDNYLVENLIRSYFVLYPNQPLMAPLSIFRIFSYVCGHADWGHFAGNFYLILLIGPVLEEKYGSKKILIMVLVTTLVTGLLTMSFFTFGVLGASGIAFMLIILSSATNFRKGELPLTFILIVILYLGRELMMSLGEDQISQFGHIIGGVIGGVFGFFYNRKVMSKNE